jgi:8-oxo-(d)GTP phosphatase
VSSDVSSDLIRAAGGLIVRGERSDHAEMVVVHRPRYDDWTLPKGKEDPGESPLDCATREVLEETGLRARIVGHAGTARYRAAGQPKQVEYYLMRPYRFVGFDPNDEVDEVRWIPLSEAPSLLTYDFDRELVAEVDLQGMLSYTDMHLVRHGAAGDRSEWNAPDHLRPLTDKGFGQARALADQLDGIGITRILTSPYVRCVQTVEVLADRIGIEGETSDALAEGADQRQIADLIDKVAGTSTVLSSHGDVIPAMLQRLQWMGVEFLSPFQCKKGSTWVVGHDGLGFDEAIYLGPP